VWKKDASDEELDTRNVQVQYGVMRHVTEAPTVTEPVFLILISLAKEPRHGYALLKDIAEISNERVQLSTGTLYGALHRLLKSGCIERFATDDTSRDKQSYRLTPEGLTLLQQEYTRLKQLTRIVSSRLRVKEAR
jgi:DNA-binding PadR family transcriptional regulator